MLISQAPRALTLLVCLLFACGDNNRPEATVTPGNLTVPIGMTVEAEVIETGLELGFVGMEWTVESPSIATARWNDNKLAVEGRAVGTTRAIANYYGTPLTVEIEVVPAVAVDLRVDQPAVSTAVGISVALHATAKFSDGRHRDVTTEAMWELDDPSLATIAHGALRGDQVGTTLGHAKFAGLTATFGVAVTDAILASITVDPPASTIPLGLHADHTAIGHFSNGSHATLAGVSWSIDAPIATLANGRVTGTVKGATNVRASLGALSGSAAVTITDAAVTGLVVSPDTGTVPMGRSLPLRAIALLSDATTKDVTNQVGWQSMAPLVASVDSDGTARGHVVGSTQVRANLGALQAAAQLQVTSAVLETLECAPLLKSIAKGTNVQLSATGVFSDGIARDLTADVSWASDSPLLINVAGGFVLGLLQGSGKITASIGGLDAVCDIIVTNATVLSISVSAPATSIALGTQVQLTATALFSDLTTQDVTSTVDWSSTQPGRIGVSAAGKATALTAGTSIMRATLGLVQGALPLEATAATLVSIDVSPASLSLAMGTSRPVTATAHFSDGSTQDVTNTALWTSSSPLVASVTNGPLTHGDVLALLVGSTTVTARVGQVTASLGVQVTAATVSSIVVSPASLNVPVGTTASLTAIAHFSDNTTQDVTASAVWVAVGLSAMVSNAPGSQGRVTGLLVGTSAVQAVFGGATGSAQVTTTSAVLVGIQVSPSSLSLPHGTSGAIVATAVFSDGSSANVNAIASWSSSSPSTASVIAGVVTGHATGHATVTASIGGISADVSVDVTAAALGLIGIDPPLPSVAAGTTLQLTANGIYSDLSTLDITSQVTWQSSAPSIVSVSNAPGSRGRLEGLVPGVATITASLDGVTAQVVVTVTAATMVAILVEPTVLVIASGLTHAAKATAVMSDGSTLDVTAQATWTSLFPGFASVSSTGLVSAHTAGASVVTASIGLVSGVLAVTVSAAVLQSLQISPATVSMPAGTSTALVATGHFSDGSHADLTANVTWSSNASGVASVSNGLLGIGAGRVQANAAGTATITAALGSTTATASVEVGSATLVSIEVVGGGGVLPLGLLTQLTAFGTYSDGSVVDITALATWDATGIAVLVSNGLGTRGRVTAVALGQSTVSASLGGKTGELVINTSLATLLSIDVSSTAAVPLGGTAQLVATGHFSDGSSADLTAQASWSSSSPSKVSVAAGLVTAHAVGTAQIEARIGLVAGTRLVEASAATLNSISVSPTSASLAVGLSTTLAATGHYSDGSTLDLTSQVAWSSSAPARATVAMAPAGLVVAVSAGSTTITAQLGGVSTTATITVTAAVLQSISIAGAPVGSFALAQMASLTATAHYSDNSTVDVTALASWGSSAGAITVSNAAGQKGRATATAIGSANVTATLAGVVGSASLTVAAGGCHVVINEVKTGGLILSQDEFVELYNPCAFEVDISRMRLVYRIALGLIDISLLDLGSTMAPGAYRVYGGASFVGLSDGSIAIDLSQLGGSIGLRDIPSGAKIDALGWGTGLGDLIEGLVGVVIPSTKSLARIPNGQDTDNNSIDFAVRNPTPRAANN